MIKRLFALMLSVLLVAGLLPANVSVVTAATSVVSAKAVGFNQSDFEEYVVESVLSLKEEIDLSVYGDYFTFRYDGNNLLQYIHDKYPALDFQGYADKYVDLYNLHTWSYGIVQPANDPYKFTLKSVSLAYYFSQSEYESRNFAYKAVAAAMVQDLKTDALSDVQKALILHDRLATHCEYDQENYDKYVQNPAYQIPPDSFNMYGALVNGMAVCQGYSKAYKYMLDLLGIPNRLCASEKAAHMWNIVTVDGKEYHVDVTHDDPVRDIEGRVYHTNFLVSTEKFKSANINSDDFDPTPVDTTYDNYFWGDSLTTFQYVNGKIYYVDNTSPSIKSWDGVTNERVVGISPFTDNFIRLCSYRDQLYYLYKNQVYRVDVSQYHPSAEAVWKPTLEDGKNAYGMKIANNELVLQCFVDPNNDPEHLISQTIGEVIDISNTLQKALSSAVNDCTYDGTEKTFIIQPVYEGESLINGYDFIATYKNNLNAGTAEVVLTAQNGYSGTASTVFKIFQKSIAGATISNISDKEYKGTEITPRPSVTLSGKTLKNGKDYSLEYSNNTDAGKATIRVIGKGNYKGEALQYFYIHPAKVTGVEVVSITANAIKLKWNKVPSGTGYAVRRMAPGDKEFKTIAVIESLGTVSYNDTHVSANTSYIYDVVAYKLVDGKKYGSVASQSIVCKTPIAIVSVPPKTITTAVVSKITEKDYTGKAITPKPTVSVGGKTLKYGTDYTLKYHNNKATGKARVDIIGKGKYVGTISKYFYIHPAKVSDVKYASATATSIKIKWKKASSGTGYEVRRKTSKNGKYKTIATIRSLKTTSYTDKKLKTNKTYYYSVVAFKTVDGKRHYGDASKYITAKTATATPKISYHKNTSTKKAKIKWSKVSGAKGYELYISTKKGSGYKRVYSGSKREYTKSKLKKGKTYYFKVKAYNKVDGKKVYSSFSSVKSVKIRK